MTKNEFKKDCDIKHYSINFSNWGVYASSQREALKFTIELLQDAYPQIVSIKEDECNNKDAFGMELTNAVVYRGR